MKERIGKYDIRSILELIPEEETNTNFNSNEINIKNKQKRVILSEQSIKIASLRLCSFKKHGTKCSTCGFEASFFAIEKNKIDKSYHLDLYGLKDNKEILFSKCLITPFKLGGKCCLENTRIVCADCLTKRVKNNE